MKNIQHLNHVVAGKNLPYGIVWGTAGLRTFGTILLELTDRNNQMDIKIPVYPGLLCKTRWAEQGQT